MQEPGRRQRRGVDNLRREQSPEGVQPWRWQRGQAVQDRHGQRIGNEEPQYRPREYERQRQRSQTEIETGRRRGPPPNDHHRRGGSGDQEQELRRGPRSGDIVIVVMGMTGSGKSSFISHFVPERAVGIGHSLESYTKEVELYHCRDPDLGTFWLVDTPGFNDTYLREARVLERIAMWLNRAYQQQIQLTGILYLHPIREVRVLGSAAHSLTWFRQLTGERAFRKVLLVMTFWDLVPDFLPQAIAETREAALKGTEYWGTMLALDARTSRHYKTRDSAVRVIQQLLSSRTDDDRGTYLDIQRQMSDEHRRLEDTTVGRGINSYLDEQRRYFDRELDKIRKEFDKDLKHMQQEHREDLEDQQRGFEDERARLQRDQEIMHADIATLDQRFKELADETIRQQEEVRLQQEMQDLRVQQDDIARNQLARDKLEERRQRADQIVQNYTCRPQ